MAKKPLTLTAAIGDNGIVHLEAAELTASVQSRTISGVICEYGTVGLTSAGRTIFAAGSLSAPTPTTKAKLLVQHGQQNAAVGVMASFSPDPVRPTATFTLPEGDESTDAIVKASNGLRDGLSVGVHIDKSHRDRDNNLVVTAARIYEVSLVTIPAYSSAGVTSVAAAQQKESQTMDTPESLAAALAAGEITQAEHDTRLAVITAGQPAPVPAAAPAAVPATATAAQAREPQAAPAAQGAVHTGPRIADVTAAAQALIEHLRSGGSVDTIQAALSDTIETGDTGGAYLNRPDWLGKLWQANNTDRPLINAFGIKPLTGDTATGYVWGVKPTVPSYAGGKAAVHSEVLTWTPKTVSAVDFAAGWDIARKFIDLGKGDIVADTFAMAVEDYKKQTEAYVEAQAVAGATAAGAYADVLTLIKLEAAYARAHGFSLSFLQVSATLWGEFLGATEAEADWWQRNQGTVNLVDSTAVIGGVSLSVGNNLATRAWLAGDSRAASYYEVDPPIQVQAQNIPQGGIDLGVFGYAAFLINDATALRKGTVTAPA
jgi:HK97 family phage prohead protease